MVHARAPKLNERRLLADVRRREERVGVREEKVPAINGAAVALAAFSADTAAKAAKLAQRQLAGAALRAARRAHHRRRDQEYARQPALARLAGPQCL